MNALAAVKLAGLAGLGGYSHASVCVVLDGEAAMLDYSAGACSKPNRYKKK